MRFAAIYLDVKGRQRSAGTYAAQAQVLSDSPYEDDGVVPGDDVLVA